MKPFVKVIGFVVATVIATVLFLLFPALNVWLAERPERERNQAEVAFEVEAQIKPKEQKIEQKQIRNLQNNLNVNSVSPSRPSTFKMDLSLASPSTAGVGVFGGDAGMMVFNPNEVDEKASPVFEVPPKYPGRAAREGIEGRVELELVVETDGKVSNIELILEEPKGFGFAKEAMKAMRQFKFTPSKREGVAVRQRFRKEFLFAFE